MSRDLYGHLIAVLSGSLIFSLGIPVFILQNMFPENLRTLVWRVKGFTIVPVVLVSIGYIIVLYEACREAQAAVFIPANLGRLVWLTFLLVSLTAIFFLILCAIRPLEGALWLFKRRVIRAPHYRKAEHLEDFAEIAGLLVQRKNELLVMREFERILHYFLEQPEYEGNSLDRFFAHIKELFINRTKASMITPEKVQFLLGCCRQVVAANSPSITTDPSRPNCHDVGLAAEAAEILAIELIEYGSLFDFKRTTEFIDNSPERLSHVLWETREQESGLKFAICLATLTSSLQKAGALNPVVKARLLGIYASLENDPPWISEGSRRLLGDLIESLRLPIVETTSANDVVARVRLGDSRLKRRVAEILENLKNGLSLQGGEA